MYQKTNARRTQPFVDPILQGCDAAGANAGAAAPWQELFSAFRLALGDPTEITALTPDPVHEELSERTWRRPEASMMDGEDEDPEIYCDSNEGQQGVLS